MPEGSSQDGRVREGRRRHDARRRHVPRFTRRAARAEQRLRRLAATFADGTLAIALDLSGASHDIRAARHAVRSSWRVLHNASGSREFSADPTPLRAAAGGMAAARAALDGLAAIIPDAAGIAADLRALQRDLLDHSGMALWETQRRAGPRRSRLSVPYARSDGL